MKTQSQKVVTPEVKDLALWLRVIDWVNCSTTSRHKPAHIELIKAENKDNISSQREFSLLNS